MRFHVAALPHTVTAKAYSSCAYTQKILNFCKMMHDLGHEVFHYGAEGSEVVCTEHIQVISTAEQEHYYGDRTNYTSVAKWDPEIEYWKVTNQRITEEINKRAQQKDFVCIVGGTCQQPITKGLRTDLVLVVEPFIGYYGTFANFRVFETYTHQSAVYGTQSRDPDGKLYDAVIPNYYDLNDFPVNLDLRQDYLLYIGRLIQRKGIQIALQAARAADIKLVMAGQGVVEQNINWIKTEEGMVIPLEAGKVEYFGQANVEERAALMGNARAVIMPTIFMEPFGGVAVETQLCGTPVISTDYASFSETVEHGKTGWRCHTLEQFVWAIKNIDKLEGGTAYIRERAATRYSLERVGKMFDEYFTMLTGLWDEGWPKPNPSRTNLDWLKI